MPHSEREGATVRRVLGEIAFVAGVALTLWLVAHFGLAPVGLALSKVGLGGVLLLTLAHAPTVVTIGSCWWLLAGEAGGDQPGRFIWGRLMRDASSNLLPFSRLGDYVLGVRAVVLTGISAVDAAVSSIVDVVVEQAAKAPYMLASVACLLWFAPGAKLSGPVLGMLLVSVALTVAAGLRWNFLRRQLIKAVSGAMRLWPGNAASARASVESVLAVALAQRRRLTIGFGLQLAGWFLGAGEAWLALRLLGTHVTYPEAVAIDGAYSAIRAVAFVVPAGIGVQEGSYVTLLAMFAVDAPTALAFSLVCRARDVMTGAPVLLAWQFMERGRRIGRSAQPASGAGDGSA